MAKKEKGSSNKKIEKEDTIKEVDVPIIRRFRKRRLYVFFDDIEEEKSEDVIDRELENEENMSIALIVLFLLACLIGGLIVGYFIYRLVI